MGTKPLTITAEGGRTTVEVPSALATHWKAGAEIFSIPFPPEAVLYVRGSARASGLIAASLSSFPIEEIFGFIVSGCRTGRLVVTGDESRKTVSFKDGQVVFATSTAPWERLGSALVSLGVVSAADLQDALTQVGPGAKLGQVLIRTGKLTHPRLYSAMTFLVREIVVDLLCVSEGHALFLEDAPLAEDRIKLQEATRDLVLSGIKRSEEVARLRRRLTRHLRVGAGPRAPDDADLPLWNRVRAPVTLASLREGYEGSEHAFLGEIDRLLSIGVLAVRPATAEVPTAAPVSGGQSVLDEYDALVKSICDALTTEGHGLSDLRSFLSDPLPGMEKALEGVTLSDDGHLDTARLMQNVAAEGPQARARGYEALDAFVSYALFSARNLLPADVADQLTRAARALQEEAE